MLFVSMEGGWDETGVRGQSIVSGLAGVATDKCRRDKELERKQPKLFLASINVGALLRLLA